MKNSSPVKVKIVFLCAPHKGLYDTYHSLHVLHFDPGIVMYILKSAMSWLLLLLGITTL